MVADTVMTAQDVAQIQTRLNAMTNTRRLWVLWRYWLVREFKTRYAGSVLGLAWAVIQPLATLAIFYVLFGLNPSFLEL